MIKTALIVGGGVGGMTAALQLRRSGVHVTLIDIDPQWRVYGAGITLTGLSLRALDRIGVLPEVKQKGFVSAGLRAFSLDGTLQFESPTHPESTPVQSTGGILRPVLHEILAQRVRASDIDVRLGVTVQHLSQDEQGVNVRFSDDVLGRYDLIVGADGIFSSIREMIFPHVSKPQFTGQGCWRIVVDRPPQIDRTEIYYGGSAKAGMVPISVTQMYMFVLEHVPANPRFAPEVMVSHVRRLLEPFGGRPAVVRDALTADAMIVYRPLEWLLLPSPWYQGRVVLIGDAAHATTPHMASGAGLAAEDSLVLAEELARNAQVERALAAFMARRFARVKMVVERSVAVGEIEMSGENVRRGSALLRQSMAELQSEY